jgi:hypothetical protein
MPEIDWMSLTFNQINLSHQTKFNVINNILQVS